MEISSWYMYEILYKILLLALNHSTQGIFLIDFLIDRSIFNCSEQRTVHVCVKGECE